MVVDTKQDEPAVQASLESPSTKKEKHSCILIYGFPGTGKSTFKEEAEEEGYTIFDTDDLLAELAGGHNPEGWAKVAESQADKVAQRFEAATADADAIVTNLHSIFPILGYKPDYAFVLKAGDVLSRVHGRENSQQWSLDTLKEWTEDDTFATIRKNVGKVVILGPNQYILDYVDPEDLG